MSELVRFEIASVGPDASAPLAVGTLAHALRASGAEAVEPLDRPVFAPGSKLVGLPPELAVAVVASTLPAIVAAIAGWLARRPEQRIKVRWRDGEREIELECSRESLVGAEVEQLIARLRGAFQDASS